MRAVRTRLVAVGLVTGTLLLVGVVGAVVLWDEDAQRGAPDVSSQPLQPYDPSFVNLWVRGCASSGESIAFCRCAIDEYTTRLRPDEFETASAVAQGGGHISELPANVRDVVKDVERECR